LQTRIGLLNLTRVIKTSKKLQAQQADLRARIQEMQKKFEVLKNNATKLQAEVDDPNTAAARREELTRQVRLLKREMEDEQEGARKTVEKANGDTFGLMYREIEDVAKRIASARALELVLFYNDAVTEADFYNPSNLQRKMSQPGALMPMVVAPGMDITETVIEAIDLSQGPTGGSRR
jgi:Skp family chaperone for outer membrane proteins